MRKMVLMMLVTIPLSGRLSAVTTINSSSLQKYGATINGTGKIVIDDRHLEVTNFNGLTVNDGATVTITGNDHLSNDISNSLSGTINGTLTITNNTLVDTINGSFLNITIATNGTLIISGNPALSTLAGAIYKSITVNTGKILNISNNLHLSTIGVESFNGTTINGSFVMNNSNETTIDNNKYRNLTLGDVSFSSMPSHLLPIHTYTLTYFTSIGKTVPDDQQTTEHLNILAASMPLGEISKSMAAEKMEFGY